MRERAAMRIGGWGALAAAAIGLARLGAGVMVTRSVIANLGPSPAEAAALGALGVLAGLALLAAVRGVRAALAPPAGVSPSLLRTATLAGGLGAVATMAAAVLAVLRPAGGETAELTANFLAVFAGGFWIAGVCAVDARLRRLPAWLRVVGVGAAVCTMSTAVLSAFALLALPLTLVWWIGLGLALLRLARTPLPAAAEAG